MNRLRAERGTVTNMQIALVGLVVGFLVSFGLTPGTMRLAHRFGILDHPGEGPDSHKQHAMPVAYLGGIAIALGTIAGALPVTAIDSADPSGTLRSFLVGLGIAGGLSLIGLIDDVRVAPRFIRFFAQLAAAVGAWAAGFRVSLFGSELANLVLSIVWIVGITNAFNLLDNMDGLTAGLAGIAAFAFAGMGILGDLPILAVISAAVCGGAFGFLIHNRHPAKVFMGDAGSLFLGFVLALIGVRIQFNNLKAVTFLVPVVVLGLPIFDTTLVVLSRLRHGRSPFKGARDHVSHRLVRLGLPVPAAVGLLYWTALCLGWLGLVVSRSNGQVGWMLLGFVMTLGVFFGVLLWKIPGYEEQTSPLPSVQEAVDLELMMQRRAGEGGG